MFSLFQASFAALLHLMKNCDHISCMNFQCPCQPIFRRTHVVCFEQYILLLRNDLGRILVDSVYSLNNRDHPQRNYDGQQHKIEEA